MYQKIRGKMANIAIKAKKEGLKLCFSVVLAEYILAISLFIGVKYDLQAVFEPKTVIIYQAKAEMLPEAKTKPKETTQDIIKRVAQENDFKDYDLLIRIAKCESSLNTYAKNNNSSARGLYQILDMHGLTENERYDAEFSTKWAIDKIKANGTNAWNESKDCWNK